jgi:DNA-binding GntR family transcriptional regulator
MTLSVIESGRGPEGITVSSPIPPPGKRQQITDDIIAAVRAGELKPGDRILSTSQLMAKYVVSITPVRAAVDDLKARKLLVGAKGRAVFVADPLPEWITVSRP